MHIVLLIAVFLLWAFVSKAAGGIGRSRGSFRYQRRKARQLGLDPEAVEVQSRYAGMTDFARTQAKINHWARWLWVPVVLFWGYVAWEFMQKSGADPSP